MALTITERDESGRVIAAYSTAAEKRVEQTPAAVTVSERKTDWRHFFSGVFLPAGYPASVSPDYLQYQIYNALQAFCSSLAGLMASRAVLEGHGVGNASASATHAILITVVQDIFSRLTTIVAAYYLGTSLYPEAKTYRLLADVFNDVAILLDALSPYLSAIALSYRYPFVLAGSGSAVRICALCLSGAFRAMCGVSAGGSKAALTVHFASDGKGTGDVGDLSAKDASKETVLALLGMLLGTVVMQYVHGARETYTLLFILIACHLSANYLAVRVVTMRSLNRQRANAVWMAYRSNPNVSSKNDRCMLAPDTMAKSEHIFIDPASLYDSSQPRRFIGRCFIGSTLASILPTLSGSQLATLLDVFSEEKYVIWSGAAPLSSTPHFHVCLKAGHSPFDHLKGWAHAQELALHTARERPRTFAEQLDAVRATYALVVPLFASFVDAARRAGWKIEEGGLLVGSPRTISVEDADEAHVSVSALEDRKRI